MPKQDDEERTKQACVPDRISKAEEHHGTEDRAGARQENGHGSECVAL
jgi:hypothetical protein